MKIWGDIPKVSGVYGNTNKVEKTSRTGETVSKKDELTLSVAAKDFGAVLKAVRQVPDIREDKVQAVAQKIEEGQYSVPSREISSKIVDSILNKKV